ncbi:RNA polymerase sigma factor SigA [Galdieria sulphuraria]|uniref:RNA polymerase primary sigma factor n=1 Tax=Galdieria sulphuraria TaxID=130081 RepID=M2W5C6_GALSU|nr:RNA polymerase primary sigma factor [Galdieria sulphuraria]EME30976.1 RNA polymerase primary sigma factor [Galdieria sulphuraria]GJD10953.1 RNA polymerase sigma factor SigA [Galdieria sulphuraria]|eukprot:XP_005707496.1 RNA polymerase primary sigma factor [Galdieria sulphuraria]
MKTCSVESSGLCFSLVTPFHFNILRLQSHCKESSQLEYVQQTIKHSSGLGRYLRVKAITCVGYARNCKPCVTGNGPKSQRNERYNKKAAKVENSKVFDKESETYEELSTKDKGFPKEDITDKLCKDWDIEALSSDALVEATLQLEKSLNHQTSIKKTLKETQTLANKETSNNSFSKFDLERTLDKLEKSYSVNTRFAKEQKSRNDELPILRNSSVVAIRNGNNSVFNLREYLENIQQSQAVRHNEELKLTENIKRGLLADTMFKELSQRLNREPTVYEWADALQVSAEKLEEIMKLGRISKQALVTLHMGLIRMIAREVLRSRFSVDAKTSFMDLVQEGSVGVLRAAEKYDGKLGWKFSTYASWWIRATMNRALEEHSRSVHIPVGVLESYHLAKKLETSLKGKLGRTPTDEEIAREMGVSVKKLRFCIQSVHNRPMSLDSFFSTADGSKDADSAKLIPDSKTDEAIDTIVESMLRTDLEQLIDEKLKPKEKQALMLRFGLEDGVPRSLEECGRIMALSCERVRKLVLAGLEKLRHPSVIQKLEVYA